jgi:hypothetical protein
MTTEDYIKLSDEGVAPLCYIAAPYGDLGGPLKVDANITVVRETAVWLVEQGFYFIAAHLNSARFETYVPSASIAHWYAQDLRLMDPCDVVVLAGKWPTSRGVSKERQVAAEKGQPEFDFTTEEGRADLLAWREQWVAKRLGMEVPETESPASPAI